MHGQTDRLTGLQSRTDSQVAANYLELRPPPLPQNNGGVIPTTLRWRPATVRYAARARLPLKRLRLPHLTPPSNDAHTPGSYFITLITLALVLMWWSLNLTAGDDFEDIDVQDDVDERLLRKMVRRLPPSRPRVSLPLFRPRASP